MAVSIRARRQPRWHLYAFAILISLFIVVPMYLIAVAAFTPRAVINGFPKPIIPVAISIDTMQAFLASRGIDLTSEQQTKTRTALEFFAKQLADGGAGQQAAAEKAPSAGSQSASAANASTTAKSRE